MAQYEMSRLQRFIARRVSPETAAAMEAHSRGWLVTCPHCGHQRPLWELGGIRYKGTSDRQHTKQRCPACGKTGWHRLLKADNFPTSDAPTASLARPILLLTLFAMLFMFLVIGLLTGLVFFILWLSGVFG